MWIKNLFALLGKFVVASLAAVTMILCLSTCRHDPLCFNHRHYASIRVDVDWSDFTQETPTGFTLRAYKMGSSNRGGSQAPSEGKTYATILTNNIAWADVNLVPGEYNLLVFNQSDFEFGGMSFEGMDSWNEASVRAVENTRVLWCKSKADTKVVYQPEWLAFSRLEGVTVTEDMLPRWQTIDDAITFGNGFFRTRAGGATTREFTRADYVTREGLSCPPDLTWNEEDKRYHGNAIPRNVISTLHVRMHIKGIYNLLSARAVIDGMAEGWRFCEDHALEGKVINVLQSWSLTKDQADPTQGHIDATITTFGLPYGHGATASENKFAVQLLLVDNETTVTWEQNVGNLIEHVGLPEEMRLELELWYDEALPDVKPVEGSSGAFDAYVEDWGDDEECELIM